jgi:hypothetical protein
MPVSGLNNIRSDCARYGFRHIAAIFQKPTHESFGSISDIGGRSLKTIRYAAVWSQADNADTSQADGPYRSVRPVVLSWSSCLRYTEMKLPP